jgi:hypothetical protein
MVTASSMFAVGLGEGGLALHHARAGLVAQLLDLICRDCHLLELRAGRV